MMSSAADWVFASIAEPIPMVSASSPTRIRPMSSGMRRIPATEASAKASGDSMNPENSTIGSAQKWPGGSRAIRRNGAGALQPPAAPVARSTTTRTRSKPIRIRRPARARRPKPIRWRNGEVFHARRRGSRSMTAPKDNSNDENSVTEAEPSASRAKRDLVLRILSAAFCGEECAPAHGAGFRKGFAVSISVSDLARRPLVAPHLPPMSPS